MNIFLLIGLGNPGAKYQHTRHNLGFQVLKAWAKEQQAQASNFKDWHKTRFEASLAQVSFNNIKITCLFPLTFMNNSGQAVRAYTRGRISRLWQTLPLEQILIIHDELELPLGQVKIKRGGSARGHNGVKSIQQSLGTQSITRLLLGIGPKPAGNVSQFVLGKFTPEQKKIIQQQTIPQGLDEINNFIKNPPRNPTDE